MSTPLTELPLDFDGDFAPLGDASPPLDPVEPAVHERSRIGGEAGAWLGSLLIHFGCIMTLAAWTLAPPHKEDLLDLAVSAVEEPELDEQMIPREVAASDKPADALGALSAGGLDGSAMPAAPLLAEQSLAAQPASLIADLGEKPIIELGEQTALQGPVLSDALPTHGVGSVGETGAEGAVDRLTKEILTSLEDRPTLVAWLFDESGSLRNERKRILERFHQIYEELGVLEAADNPAFSKHQDKPLLTAVVGFGAEPHLITKQPTDRFDEIESAVKSIRDDESGQENVFRAVTTAAEQFRRYRGPAQGRRNVMLVVFTDEAGDDVAQLDDAIALCRKLAIPVYVVGRPAPFGRQTAYVKWIDPDPKFDQRPQWAPVTMGPETLAPELLKLDFVGQRGPEPLLDSGFGPYALTRLCYETGGVYFAVHPNRAVGREVTGEETENLAAHFSMFFDGPTMRRYQPDYLPAAEYLRIIRGNRAEQALVEAAQLTWTTQLEDVRLRFAKRDEAQLAQELSQAQRAAAMRQPKIDQLARLLMEGEADRAAIKEPRWQAGFDLALGRVLAAKSRTDGYNLMLAQVKQGRPFKEAKHNTWILRPAEEFASSPLEKTAKRARELLDQVVKDHPGTPWAYFAEQELSTPLGWQWSEGSTKLPPINDNGDNPPPKPERKPPPGPVRRNPPPL